MSTPTAEMSALLHLVVSAMVTDTTAVKGTAIPGPARLTVFSVIVGPRDKGKVIGKQGRTARSLRIVLNAIAKEHGQKFSLDVNGDPVSGADLE
ncbi:MAG: KH domain-containing protein [Janthinobacterium lividum]